MEEKIIEMMGTMVSVSEELIEMLRTNNTDGLLSITVDADGYISARVGGYDLTRTDSCSPFHCFSPKGYQE